MHYSTLIDIAGPGLLYAVAGSILLMLCEGAVLMLFKRKAARENWKAALISNCASYLLVILPLFNLGGLLK